MIKHSTSSQSKTHLIFLSQIIMKHFLLFLFLLFYSNFSLGQNLVEYTAIGNTNPSSTAANMLATPISVNGVTATGGGIINASNWSTGGYDNTKYYEVTLTPQGGYKLNLNNLEFDERRSLSGIRNFEVRTNLGDPTFTTTVFTGNVPDDDAIRTQSFAFPASFDNVTSAITIRIYGYNAETTIGTWRIASYLRITGTVESNLPANIALTFDDTGNTNIAQGSNNNVIFRTFANVTDANATLSQVVLRTAGNYANTDIKANGFKLWYSTDNFLNAGDVELKATGSVSGNGETITFTGLYQSLPTSAFNYLFVTVDITGGALINNTVQID